MASFDGAVVLIAGGASGIGRALACELARSGAQVGVANRSGRSLDAFRAENLSGVVTYETDMTMPQQVESLVQNVVKRFGRIDYFFNCVGIVQGGEVKDTPLEVERDVLRTNLDSTAFGAHFVYRQMVAQGSGHIVNLASAAGLLPTPLMAFYTMTKAGIVGFSHALRAEAKLYGIKVSVACPGFVMTPIYEKSHYSHIDKRKAIHILFHRAPIQTPEAAARRIIHGVRRNQATIHTWYSTRPAWCLYRLSPTFYIWLAGRSARVMRSRLAN